MKKTFFSLLAAISLLSCTKESVPVPGFEDFSISATLADGDARTSYFGTGSLVWSYGDKINIFDGTASNEFTTYVTDNPSTATFFGQITAGAKKFTAVYPYDKSNALLSDGGVRIHFPSSQKAVPGGFTDGSNPSMGVTTSSSSLVMRNAGAYIKLAFTSSKAVRAIYIASNTEGVNLTGELEFDPSTAALKSKDNGVNYVTLYPVDGSIAEGTYYAVVAPVRLTKGVRVFFRLSDGKLLCRKGVNSISLTRNKTVDLGTIDVDALSTAVEPKLDGETLVLNFATADGAFTEPLPSAVTSGEHIYKTSVGGYEMTFLVNPIDNGGNERNQGWSWIKSGYLAFWANNCWEKGSVDYLDGISLPSIPGKRLIKVEYYAPGNTFPMNVTDRNGYEAFYDDDFENLPADKYNSSKNWLKGLHVFSLPNSRIGESYRLVARKSSSFCNISMLVLSYETIEPSSIGSLYPAVPETGTETFEGLGFEDITDDGGLNF